VQPRDEVIGCERPHPRRIPGEVGRVEEVPPLAARAPAEERDRVDPVVTTTGRHGHVGPPQHRLERRRLDETRPPVVVDVGTEMRGQPLHLPAEVGLQVVVVQQDDVEIVGGIAERLNVLDGEPQRHPSRLRRRRLVVDRGRPLSRRDERVDVRVVEVTAHRQRRVAWVASHADVRDPRIVGDPVERGVGLDEPAVGLGAQIIRIHVVPHFGGVLMMSPARSSSPSQRLLSKIVPS
jgi:hypothetical protein